MRRENFFGLLEGKVSYEGLLLIQRGYWFAKNTHRPQMRDGGDRYFEHCRRAALTLIERGIYDSDAITLALIHDVVEDGFTPPGVILTLFGARLYGWAFTISKNLPVFNDVTGKVIAWAKRDAMEYYREIGLADIRVRLVKLADRLDNIRTADVWPKERIERYVGETSFFVLPIAKNTDAWFADEIQKAIQRLEALASP